MDRQTNWVTQTGVLSETTDEQIATDELIMLSEKSQPKMECIPHDSTYLKF